MRLLCDVTERTCDWMGLSDVVNVTMKFMVSMVVKDVSRISLDQQSEKIVIGEIIMIIIIMSSNTPMFH